ncbi:MAG TPA: hypothetical protein VJH90_00550 [archaeon]|nr:hypothetical protein [archaeon]
MIMMNTTRFEEMQVEMEAENTEYHEEEMPILSAQERLELYNNNMEAIDKYVERAIRFTKEENSEAVKRSIEEAYLIANESGELAKQILDARLDQLGLESIS